MQTDLTELIERVESGAGSDRQLEIDIWVALGWSHEKRDKDRKPWLYPAADGSTIVRRDPGDVVWWHFQRMDITESLDAVLSLIEAKLPGRRVVKTETHEHGNAYVEIGWQPEGSANPRRIWIDANAPTLARAALSAALRAIQESRNDR